MSQSNRRTAATKSTTFRTLGALACAAALFGTMSVASAADAQGSNTPTNATPYTSPSASSVVTTKKPKMSHSQRKAAHAQRKAAGKARRAEKNAELSTLEKNGYNPASNDPKYPSNLQNAERKAAGQPTQPSGQ